MDGERGRWKSTFAGSRDRFEVNLPFVDSADANAEADVNVNVNVTAHVRGGHHVRLSRGQSRTLHASLGL